MKMLPYVCEERDWRWFMWHVTEARWEGMVLYEVVVREGEEGRGGAL